MNTPDTEWEKEINAHSAFPYKFPQDIDLVIRTETVKQIVTTLLTSRDTYWKERVRKEVEGMRRKFVTQPETYKGSDANVWREGYNDALDTLLDNLK